MRTNSFLGCALVLLGGIVFACEAPVPQDDPLESGDRPSTEQKATAGDSGAKGTCGNSKCDPGESCQSCPQDCGQCTVCSQARACSTGLPAPSSFTPVPALDVKLEARDKSQILADLVRAAERGEPGLLALMQLARMTKSGPPAARELLGAHPKIAGALSRQLLGRTEIAEALAKVRVAPSSKLMSNGDAGTSATPDGGGVESCDAPKLTIQAQRLVVKNPDDDIVGDVIWCNVAAQSPGGADGKILPKTPNLYDGDTFSYTPTESRFWGKKGPADPKGDLEIRYDCFEQDSLDGYERFVAAASDIVREAGGMIDTYGGYTWTGAVVDLIGEYLPLIVALDSDDHLFSVAQTIPRGQQLALANGASWKVHKKGTHLWSDWDWTLEIQAYGCTDNGTAK